MRSFVLSSGTPHNIQLVIFYHIQPKWEGFSRRPLIFTENSELEAITNSDKVQALTNAMLEAIDKKNLNLAHNTALLVHGIYGLRSINKEVASVSEYGLKTWWMTNQIKVLKYTADIIRSNRSHYIMRPEFVLNFIAMSPKCEQVRNSFKDIFPSVFGIQLGHRLKDDVFHGIMSDVQTWKEHEPGRITALMSDLSDKLKSDRLKRYDQSLENDFI